MWHSRLWTVAIRCLQKPSLGQSGRTIEGVAGAAIAGCFALIARESIDRLTAPISLSIGGQMQGMTLASYWAIRFREILTWEVWGVCLLLGSVLGITAYWLMTTPLPSQQFSALYRRWFLLSFAILMIGPRLVGLLYWALFTKRSPLVEHWGAFWVGNGIGLMTTLLTVWLLWQLVVLSNYILERWWE